MKRLSEYFHRLLAAAALFAGISLNAAASYEAPLPAQLSTDPDLCAFVACEGAGEVRHGGSVVRVLPSPSGP